VRKAMPGFLDAKTGCLVLCTGIARPVNGLHSNSVHARTYGGHDLASHHHEDVAENMRSLQQLHRQFDELPCMRFRRKIGVRLLHFHRGMTTVSTVNIAEHRGWKPNVRTNCAHTRSISDLAC